MTLDTKKLVWSLLFLGSLVGGNTSAAELDPLDAVVYKDSVSLVSEKPVSATKDPSLRDNRQAVVTDDKKRLSPGCFEQDNTIRSFQLGLVDIDGEYEIEGGGSAESPFIAKAKAMLFIHVQDDKNHPDVVGPNAPVQLRGIL